MSFLEDIFIRLDTSADQTLLTELREPDPVSVTGRQLADLIARARTFLARRGLRKGDRCALLGRNSIRWVAMDLAILAEGLTVVPLYWRQAPSELAAMIKDSSPALLGLDEGAELIVDPWSEALPQFRLDEVFSTSPDERPQPQLEDSGVVAIVYTSGTSGEAKGVMLTSANVGHILECTSKQLDLLMGHGHEPDRVYQWAPFNFASAWLTLLTSLLRGSHVFLNIELSSLAAEIPRVEPDYFVNVPALLERVRRGVDEQLRARGGAGFALYSRAKAAHMRKYQGRRRMADFLWLLLADALVFPSVRRRIAGSNLKALISGSAPLALETQLYFMMLGIPVLQAYGLTETTGICTLDDPDRVEPGRVGRALAGTEMKLGEQQEILVRGPHVFPGYWNRPEETAKVLRGGWFHSGDQGEVDRSGNWKIVGRIKNLIILNSGHNIAPEPIEEEVAALLAGAQQVVLIGNRRSYLTAIVTGSASPKQVQAALDTLNSRQPHYKQVRAFRIHPDPFTIENGLLTANGKLKRDLIGERLKSEIDEMYAVKHPSTA